MPPTGRHPCRHGRTGRGNADPKTAWPQSIAHVAVLALSPPTGTTARRRLRQAITRRGNWTGRTRSCPHAYPLRAHDQSRGPFLPACLSRRSSVLRPPRTPAAPQGSGVGSRRETPCGDSFPATPPQTGHEVLPHPALPRAVGCAHSAVPMRWRTPQATSFRHGPGHQRWTGKWHHSKPAALPAVSHTRLQALRSGRFCCSAVQHYYDLLRPPLGAPPLHSPAAYRLRLYRQSRCGTTQPAHPGYSGAETDLSCSAMNCATIPPSLPRWVHRHCTPQDLRAVHGLRPVKKGSAPTSLP
jgi:hypothetical protein